MKTPEEMAEEYAEIMSFEVNGHQRGFLAGYNAAQPKWVSVEERLPELDQWCTWWDVSCATEPCTAFRDKNDTEMWWENYTHWMPLPAPPREKE